MKAIIIYYSFSGKTKQVAESVSRALGVESIEVIEKKRHSKIGAYFVGARHAMKGEKTDIMPIQDDLFDYDHVILFSPVWAGSPVPAINAVIDSIRLDGVNVIGYLTLASKESIGAELKLKESLESHGAKLMRCSQIQTNQMNESWLATQTEMIVKQVKELIDQSPQQ